MTSKTGNTEKKWAIRRQLKAVGKQLQGVDGLHAKKVKLLRAGRQEGILLREMGDDLGISESAVIKALKRDDAHA